jgi:hypothetical protein
VRRGILVALVLASVAPACSAGHYSQVACRGVHRQSIFVLEAQAIPSATLIPCIQPTPAGWAYAGSEVRTGFARFWFDSDRAGVHAVEVTMTPSCDVSGMAAMPAGSSGVRRYVEPSAWHPDLTVRRYLFDGGCVTTRFAFTRRSAPALLREASRFLAFTPRSVYVQGVRDDEGLTLCGAGAPPCLS